MLQTCSKVLSLTSSSKLEKRTKSLPKQGIGKCAFRIRCTRLEFGPSSAYRLRISGLMNLSTSRGQPEVEPNHTTFCGSFSASSDVISKMGEPGLQYRGSIAPALRVRLPLSGESVMVHHLGHSS